MTRQKVLMALALSVVGAALTAPAAQQSYPYYSNWGTYYNNYGGRQYTYYTCNYYYAPNEYHYACYYPYVNRRYVYYYNYHTRRYWGRYDLEAKGDNKYSLLPDSKKKEFLTEIENEDFPAPIPLSEVAVPPAAKGGAAPPKGMPAPPPLPKQ